MNKSELLKKIEELKVELKETLIKYQKCQKCHANTFYLNILTRKINKLKIKINQFVQRTWNER